MNKLFLSLILSILCGCASTITPNHVVSNVAAIDTSTPSNYGLNDNGFIGYRQIDGKWYGIITENKRKEINDPKSGLIAKYQIQFKSAHPGVWLMPNDGLIPWIDPYGNHLWAVDLTMLGYYMNLEQWKRDQKPGDSLWIKTLEAL